MNRLGTERSPYLLQHAANPVDWFPWGEEAFARARVEQKPIFLSVGYSTCHWCHVMEHESFENADVARVLNGHFVAIKVDREERPDVDRVYMAFVQATTGSGGWPMSVWLTPDLKPFYGGTYFPPSSRWGRPGFVDILQEIARVWNTDRDKVRESADEVTERLRGLAHADQRGTTIPGATALERTVGQFKDAFDPRHAGFGGAPKFPRPSELLLLLREFARTGDGDARDMAAATLRAIAAGGMRDHVGGGFHRYSVDAAWRVPHFEKMLYDQAQLALAYVEASQAVGDPALLDVAEDTLRYVMREMTDQSGGFYSAEDADSVPPERAGDASAHKSEGAFYLWRADELDALLGAEAAIVKGRFGVEPAGNAPSDPQQEFTGKNLLYAARTLEELAQSAGTTPARIADVLERARLQMFAARLKRPRPHLDDKVLTAWNGLMIAAFARTARVADALGRDGGYLLAARKAASFIRATMWDPATRVLLRRYRAGHAEIEGYAEDYAYLIYGVVELFQADPRPEWLEWAITLQDRQDELFWDARESGWFSTTGRDPSILMRAKDDYDGAEPAASSIAVENLLTLAHLVDRPEWRTRVEATLRLFGPRLDAMGRAVPMMAAALSHYTAGPQQLVVLEADFSPADSAGSLTTAVAHRYLPFATVLSLDAERQAALALALPLIGEMKRLGGRATAYVCRNFACSPPATSVGELERRLNRDATY
jgi:uncharacterized protein YyaL (SSP411 family)